jgi:hypothetical protein
MIHPCASVQYLKALALSPEAAILASKRRGAVVRSNPPVAKTGGCVPERTPERAASAPGGGGCCE